MTTVQLANQKRFEANDAVSILDAALSAGVALDHSCRTGRCGTCKAAVIEGTTRAIRNEESLTREEAAAGWILTCARAATSDVKLDIEDLGALANLEIRTLPCRISGIEKLAPDVVRLMLRLPPNSGFKYLAGQYIDVIGQGGLRRSYSIANAADAVGQLELHVRQVDEGAMSAYWFGAAKPNDLLRFEGPRGTFFLRDTAGKNLVFLATGTGIAPVKAMLESLAGQNRFEGASPGEAGPDAPPRSISVYWGGRVAADIYWPLAAAHQGVNFNPVLSRADGHWTGLRGHVQDRFLATAPELGDCVVYACGSMAMTESARKLLVAAGLPARQFHSDAFVSSSA